MRGIIEEAPGAAFKDPGRRPGFLLFLLDEPRRASVVSGARPSFIDACCFCLFFLVAARLLLVSVSADLSMGLEDFLYRVATPRLETVISRVLQQLIYLVFSPIPGSKYGSNNSTITEREPQ